jgi:eukaryotic-like serine/threonine-protein kinase
MTTPRLLSERYELGGTLGYGGMSEVHKGRDVRLSRDVAIKVLRADLARDPQFQMRFRREAQNAAALNHPAIVAVYDTGETESEFGTLPYIVMEFVDGQTLREIVKSSGPLSQQRVIEVMADVCAALDFSHRHGIIHRDVKPANVMITKSGAVKVMDFGIARALADSQNMTQTAAVIGTAQYLSPEQARGEAVDARSDVYAAGCVLFELLTGEPPFSGDSPVAVAYQHVREEVRRPSEVNPEVPHELDAVVLKAMSKNPANRYQSSAEMRQDLVRVLRGQRPLAPQVMSEEERTALLHGGASTTGATRRALNSATGATRHAAAPSWDSEENLGRSTGKMIGIGVGVVAMLAIVIFVATRIFGGPGSAPIATVPPVSGQTQAQANQNITAAGFKPSFKTQGSTTVAAGNAISSNPSAGTTAPKGTTVTIMLSTGAGPTSVPPLNGLTQDVATQQLQQAGFTLTSPVQQLATTDQTLVGKIAKQVPPANTQAKYGSPVTIYLGVAGIAVPQLKGQDVVTATTTLGQSNLVLVTKQVDGPQPASTIMSTSPPGGTVVAPGSTVVINLSNGNEIAMPNLSGMSQDQASRALRNANINASLNVSDNGDSDSSDNRRVVVSQTPKAGSYVDPDNANVTVTMGNRDSSSDNSGSNNDGSDSGNGRNRNGSGRNGSNDNDSTPNNGGFNPFGSY